MLFKNSSTRLPLKFIFDANQFFSLSMGLVTVLLFYLAFPSGGIADLAWITIVPVVIALNKIELRNAFVLGLLTATLGWMCSIWWAVNGIAEITSSSPNIVLPFVFFFCFISAIPYACACWFHVRFNLGNSLIGAFLSAIIFTVFVNYIPHILPGNLAHALYLKPQYIQLADTGGVPLVFFLIHCVNLLIANGITMIKINKLKAIHCFIMAIFLFIGNFGYGYYKSEVFRSDVIAQDKKLRVAILQPNIDISKRTRHDWLEQQKTLSKLLLNIDKEQDIDLVIFPEVPVPISYRYYSKDKAFFNQTNTQTPLLLTAIKPINGTVNSKDGYFNTMELIQDKLVKQDYAKQMLLPFGEYLPFEHTFPWLRKIFPFAPNYKAGTESTLFTIQNSKGNSIKAIPLICYEAVFTDQVASGIAQGGELMINSSNDAWFSHSAGKKVHLALSLFRSIEYRKYLIRATNNGLSGVIDPYGYFVKGSQIMTNTQGYAVVEIPITSQQSFYQQFPYLIKIIFLLLFFFISIYFWTTYVNTHNSN